MSRYLKAYNEHYSSEGTQYRIEVFNLKEDNMQAAFEFETRSGFIINYDSKDDLFTPIVASTVDFEVMLNNYADEVFWTKVLLGESYEFGVIISAYQSGWQIKWRGYVVPGKAEMQYEAVQTVKVRAHDGLALIKGRASTYANTYWELIMQLLVKKVDAGEFLGLSGLWDNEPYVLRMLSSLYHDEQRIVGDFTFEGSKNIEGAYNATVLLTEISDPSNLYNPVTGKYTAPYSGRYYFTLSSAVSAGIGGFDPEYFYDITLQTPNGTAANGGAVSQGATEQETKNVSFYLNQGDEVYVVADLEMHLYATVSLECTDVFAIGFSNTPALASMKPTTWFHGHVDEDSYQGEKSSTVELKNLIEEIFEQFNYKIFMANGVWNIIRIPDMKGSYFVFTTFDANGDEVSTLYDTSVQIASNLLFGVNRTYNYVPDQLKITYLTGVDSATSPLTTVTDYFRFTDKNRNITKEIEWKHWSVHTRNPALNSTDQNNPANAIYDDYIDRSNYNASVIDMYIQTYDDIYIYGSSNYDLQMVKSLLTYNPAKILKLGNDYMLPVSISFASSTDVWAGRWQVVRSFEDTLRTIENKWTDYILTKYNTSPNKSLSQTDLAVVNYTSARAAHYLQQQGYFELTFHSSSNVLDEELLYWYFQKDYYDLAMTTSHNPDGLRVVWIKPDPEGEGPCAGTGGYNHQYLIQSVVAGNVTTLHSACFVAASNDQITFRMEFNARSALLSIIESLDPIYQYAVPFDLLSSTKVYSGLIFNTDNDATTTARNLKVYGNLRADY
jgi:hypothetical protein